MDNRHRRTGPQAVAAATVAAAVKAATLSAIVTGCASGTSPAEPAASSDGWTLTTYYTAVESLHSGPQQKVRGCLQRECSGGDDPLGSFPRDFIQAVEEEGTGRITHGRHRGMYLNWSFDTGYWLDSAPVDTDGRPLQPYVTAAADGDALPKYARFRIVGCGREVTDSSAIDARVCDRIKASTWTVLDAFTPGLGGRRHIDLYVGEEDRGRFPETSPLSITTTGSVIRRVE